MYFIATLLLWLVSAVALTGSAAPGRTVQSGGSVDLTGATYTGSAACKNCHEKEYNLWAASLHSKMLQKADPKIVLGDFNDGKLEYLGWHFRMYRENGGFYIRETKPEGEVTIYKVDYTLGSKRIQHYLSIRPDGSMRVTFPTWDVLKGEWIHGSEIVRGSHNSSGELISLPIQIWNKHCWNCHTSQEEEGFSDTTFTFHTTFTETGINCEMCHGPGSLHVDRMIKNPEDKVLATVNAAKLPERMTDCLQCHIRRVMVKKGYHVGENIYDYYMLKFVELAPPPATGPPIWTDRHRRFANECQMLWESQCSIKGKATCFTCHDAHETDIAKDPRYKNTDVLCLQCHEKYRDAKVAAGHTHHSPTGEGSRCVECHMVLITNKTIKLLQNAEIRDHYIGVSIPENTAKHHMPNTCNNTCHEDKDLDWVIEWMDKWYPNRPRVDRVTDTMALAKERSPEAVPRLIELLDDPTKSMPVRAGAAAFLGEFRGENIAVALIRALDDPEPMLRAEAARSLSEVGSIKPVEPLKKKLSDRVRIVRLNAVFSLVKMGILEVFGSYAEDFRKADEEYRQFLREFPTVYETRVDRGTYLALHKKYVEALEQYKIAVKIRPESPLAHYYAGVTAAQLGLFDAALSSFQEVLKLDPNFRNTRQLMNQVEALRKK